MTRAEVDRDVDREVVGAADETTLAQVPEWMPRALTEPWFSVVEALDLARRGNFTAAGMGAAPRWPYIAWVWVVFLPVLAVAAFAVWAFIRPGRALGVLLGALAGGTLLELLPVTAWLVPWWACLPGWWQTIAGWAS